MRMNARLLVNKFEHCRAEYQGEEWETLRDDGWKTIAVSDDGMALLRRERRWGEQSPDENLS